MYKTERVVLVIPTLMVLGVSCWQQWNPGVGNQWRHDVDRYQVTIPSTGNNVSTDIVGVTIARPLVTVTEDLGTGFFAYKQTAIKELQAIVNPNGSEIRPLGGSVFYNVGSERHSALVRDTTADGGRFSGG